MPDNKSKFGDIPDFIYHCNWQTVYISQREEKMTNSFIFDMMNQMYVYSQEHAAPEDAVFEAETNVVTEEQR